MDKLKSQNWKDVKRQSENVFVWLTAAGSSVIIMTNKAGGHDER